jgi:DNA-directed RNA polymerase specialized sigma24 family protein
MSKCDEQALDQMILKYVRGGGDEFLFEDIHRMLAPIAKWYAYRDARPGLPRDDMERVFWAAVWEAVPGYNGKTSFMQRVMTIYKQRRIDQYRSNERNKKKGAFSWEQLDENNVPHSIPAEVEAISNIRVEEIKKMLGTFSEVHEQEGKVLKLLAQGCTGENIARAIGAPKYGARERKIVQRAREKFKKYTAMYS